METPICESCGMPTDEDTTSKHDKHYCIYCQNQETGELKTREEVEKGSIEAAVNFLGATQEEAEKMVKDMLPELPRWKK